MVNCRRIASVLVALSTVATVRGQILPAKGGYTFRTKYKVGALMSFATTISFPTKGSPYAGKIITTTSAVRVLRITNGIATAHIDIGAVKLAGQVLIPPKAVTTQLDASSEYSSLKMPRHAVAIGSTWTAVRVINLLGIPQRLNAVYRFAGVKLADGHSVAVITYSMNGVVKGTGSMKLLTKDASIYTNDVSLSVAQLDPTAKIHIVMTRKL